jgi:hypothetical protein
VNREKALVKRTQLSVQFDTNNMYLILFGLIFAMEAQLFHHVIVTEVLDDI